MFTFTDGLRFVNSIDPGEDRLIFSAGFLLGFLIGIVLGTGWFPQL